MDRLEFDGFGGITLAANGFGHPDAPPVVLIPSLGQVREYWFGSAQALADAGRYAICIDLRGHGESGHAPDQRYDLDVYVRDLHAVLAALSSRAVIVASGLGAIVAMLAVGEGAPHLVAGLALVDANIWFDPDAVTRMGGALRQRFEPFDDAGDLLDAIAALHPDEPRLGSVAPILAAYAPGRDGRLAWRGDKSAVSNADIPAAQERLSAAVARITAPVTLIRGALNTSISAEATDKLKQLIPGSEVAEIEGVGHYAAIDREDAFNALLLDFLERKVPRPPLSIEGGSDPRVLRDALGCFGTGVTAITTLGPDGAPIGLTANSFTSVSLDPPLILFSLAKKSVNLDAFERAGRFAVNVLHIGQQPVASRFAAPVENRFDGVDWSVPVAGGSPILAGALAVFDCRTYAVHDGGDHLIFIGHVQHAWYSPHRDPLLYFRGRFRRLHFA